MTWLRLALLCVGLLCAGCARQLIDTLESRGVKSCVYWNSQVTGLRAISATGGLPVEVCLADPCRGR